MWIVRIQNHLPPISKVGFIFIESFRRETLFGIFTLRVSVPKFVQIRRSAFGTNFLSLPESTSMFSVRPYVTLPLTVSRRNKGGGWISDVIILPPEGQNGQHCTVDIGRFHISRRHCFRHSEQPQNCEYRCHVQGLFTLTLMTDVPFEDELTQDTTNLLSLLTRLLVISFETWRFQRGGL